MSNTLTTIKSIVAKLKRDPSLENALGDNTDLISDLNFDSLEVLQFMLEVEEQLNIQIDFEKLEFSALEDIQILAGFLDVMPRRETAPIPD